MPAILLLLLLYTLQGVPMGLGGSIPFIMTKRKVSMVLQSQFSIVSWPFSFKLIWAPLVDSIYSSRIGRRKSWIVPAQLAIGLLLLWAANYVDQWIGEGGEEPDVWTLTKLFLCFYFLAATQDIAVDGLALTILSPCNREVGATCNAIGQMLGYFLACAHTRAPAACTEPAACSPPAAYHSPPAARHPPPTGPPPAHAARARSLPPPSQ
jgi:PAT family acetyl-CoA transporter-like MFS transporter 1